MRNFRILVTMLVGLVAFGCSHDCDDQIIVLSGDYFPLQVGNYWRYKTTIPQSEGVEVEMVVTAIAEINGKQYFKILTSPLYGFFVDTAFYRVDERGYVYVKHNRTDPAEEERYHLNAAKGEQWHTDESGIMTFNDFASVTLKEGMKMDNCRRYSFDIPQAADDETSSTLAPGIGLIESASLAWGTRMTIEEAQINGVKMTFQ